MALTQVQSAALMGDVEFHGRIKVCVVQYSDSIGIQTTPVSTRQKLVQWSFAVQVTPDSIATGLQPFVVKDSKVQDAGVDEDGHSLVSDADLQTAVETVVN